MITVRNLEGSGGFKEEQEISYSYSEDASPIQPNDIAGGVGQVNLSVVAEDGPRGSRLVINNNIELTDSDCGTVVFRAKQMSLTDDVISITGETLQSQLNAERQAPAIGGSGTNLFEAILTYCALVDIEPQFETGLQAKLEAIEVNFPGWKGNVWEHLKMLCAAVPIDAVENHVLEMYIFENELWFRQGLQQVVDFGEKVISRSLSLNGHDAAQKVQVYNYNTFYGANRLVEEQGTSGQGRAINDRATFTDSLQVNAGETLVRRFKINASLTHVNQPLLVTAISQLPYPYEGGTGEYVVCGSDGLFIEPAQWKGEGGKLEVALTENYDEIEVRITAPKSVEMPTIEGEVREVTPAPYKIGVETDGENEYPAMYITGTGVFFEKTSINLPTGAPQAYAPDLESATSVDNPFITNTRHQLMRGVAAAQDVCGPKLELRQEVAIGPEYGVTVGSIIEDYDTRFRIKSVQFSESSMSITAQALVTFADFNNAWSGKTFADFNAANTGILFNEFTMIPLVTE